MGREKNTTCQGCAKPQPHWADWPHPKQYCNDCLRKRHQEQRATSRKKAKKTCACGATIEGVSERCRTCAQQRRRGKLPDAPLRPPPTGLRGEDGLLSRVEAGAVCPKRAAFIDGLLARRGR